MFIYFKKWLTKKNTCAILLKNIGKFMFKLFNNNNNNNSNAYNMSFIFVVENI